LTISSETYFVYFFFEVAALIHNSCTIICSSAGIILGLILV